MPRTSSETQALAAHLLYEVEMVAGLVWRLKRHRALLAVTVVGGAHDPLRRELTDLAGRNADIESLGVHLRVLLDFLYDQRRDPEDAVASDFFGDPLDWKRVRPKLPRELRSIKERVGTEIAHLSYRRPSPSVSWNYDSLWAALSGVLQKFADHAEPGRVGEDVLARLRSIVEAAPVLTTTATVPVDYKGVTSWTAPATYYGGTATERMQTDLPPGDGSHAP
jgi:hypothetical protein